MVSTAVSISMNEEAWRVIPIHSDPESTVIKRFRFERYSYLFPKLSFRGVVYAWLVLVAGLEIAVSESGFKLTIPLGVLLLQVCWKWVSELRNLPSGDSNNDLYNVWQLDDVEEKAGWELLPGHLLCLNNGDLVPADVVVLASGRADCSVLYDEAAFIGTSRIQSKSPVHEIQRIVKTTELSEAFVKLNHIQGSVRFSHPNVDMNAFRGFVKLRGYPVASKIRAENLLLKGYRIVTTPWVLGIIVYVGGDCKRDLIAKSAEQRNLTKTDVFLTQLYSLLILFVILLSLLNSALSSSLFPLSAPFPSLLRDFVVLYGQATPASTFLLLDLLRLIYTYFLTIDLQDGSQVLIHNPRIVDNIGRIEYALFDSTGTVTANELRGKAVYVNQIEFRKCLSNENYHTKVCLAHDPKADLTDITTLSRKLSKCDCQFAVLGRLMKKNGTPYSSMCAAMVLCNSTLYSEMDGAAFTSNSDEALWKATQDLGITVELKSKSLCKFRIGSAEERYTILELMDYKPQIQRTRIIVQNENSEDGLLIVRGTYAGVKLLLNNPEDEADEIKRQVKCFSRSRLRSLVYCGKTIPSEQMMDVVNTLSDARMLGQISRKLDNFFHDLEKSSSFLGIVGLEDDIAEDTISATESLLQLNLNAWIISGDNEEVTVATARAVGLLPFDVPTVHLRGITLESNCKTDISRKIQSALFCDSLSAAPSMQELPLSDEAPSPWEYSERESSLKPSMFSPRMRFVPVTNGPADAIDIRNLQGNLEYAVILDGASFSTAMKQQKARELLGTLLYCASYVCCFDMQPREKMLISKLVRDNFGGRHVTLAVGDSESDIPMLKSADVSIAILNKENHHTASQCDIAVESLSVLPDLIATSRAMARTMESALLNWMLVTVLPVGGTVWFAYENGVAGCEVVIPELWVLYTIETAVAIIIMSVFPYETTKKSHKFGVGRLWVRGLRAVAMSFFQSFISTVFVYLSAKTGINPDFGYTENFAGLQVAMFLCLTSTAFVHLYVIGGNFSLTAMFTPVSFFGFSLFGVYWLFTRSSRDSGLTYVSETPAALFGIAGSVLTNLVFTAYFHIPTPFHRKSKYRKTTIIPMSSESNLENYYPFVPKRFHDSSYWLRRQGTLGYEFHPFWLTFRSSEVEEDFRSSANGVKTNRVKSTVFSTTVSLFLIYESTVREFNISRVVVYILSIGTIAVLGWFPLYVRMKRLCMFAIVTGVFATELVMETLDPLCYLVPVGYSLVLTLTWKWHAALTVWNLVTMAIVTLMFENSGLTDDLLLTIASIGAFFFFSANLVILTYFLERSSKTEFKLVKSAELSLSRSKEVFSCLFPSFVVSKVATQELPIVLEESQVTVLFIDICDFDLICSLYSPKELTQLLDDIAKKLDDLCDSNGVVKIENVGKTFLACAGLTEQEIELQQEFLRLSAARRALNLSLEIMHTFQYITLRHGALQVNIGINSGPVIAGVVGYHKPQFALIGDTVNTASRMSSTAPGPGSIQVTESTFDQIGGKSGFVWEQRLVQAKGKGEMTTYLIKEADESRFDTRARRTSVRLNSSTIKRCQDPEDSKQLLVQLGYMKTSELFTRKDTEAVESIRCMSLFKPETPKQRTFRQGIIRKKYPLLMLGLGTLSIGYSWAAILWTIELLLDKALSGLWTLVLCIAFGPCLILCLKRVALNQWLQWILPLVCITLCISISVSFDLTDELRERLMQILLAFALVYFITFGGLLVRHSLMIVIVLGVIWTLCILRNNDNLNWVAVGFSLLPVAALSLAFTYYHERHLRVYANLERAAEKEIVKTERLLKQMMPVHVYESLLQEARITDELRGVTLMFADIVGFTALSAHKSPSEMVNLLSTLFTKFDHLCVQNNVYKVHTIGDCYVAMGYTGSRAGRDYEEECVNVVSLACDILTALEEFNSLYTDLGLNMRIGIHTATGVITAGIIGSKVVRYDIYGPDVLVANKMESNGHAGRIHISDVTKEILEKTSVGQYSFEEKGRVDIPSIRRSHLGFFLNPVIS